MSTSNNVPGKIARQHHLDALRGFAMLLGIAYHAALSFTGNGWITNDTQTSDLLAWFGDSVHGFRMQLFFLVSGYFTMLLYRHRGGWALLKNRFMRIFIPLILSILTILPFLGWSAEFAGSYGKEKDSDIASQQGPLIEAILKKDHEKLVNLLKEGEDPRKPDKIFRTPPVNWAAMTGDATTVLLLLKHGSTVDDASRDFYRPLHSASFMGHPEVVRLLIQMGANIRAVGKNNDTAVDTTRVDWGSTQYIAGLMKVPLGSKEEVMAGREECIALMENALKESNPEGNIFRETLDRWRRDYREYLWHSRWNVAGEPDKPGLHLVMTPLFAHLWFLWFLCWFVVIFILLATLLHYLPFPRLSSAIVLSPWRLLWLIPLTMVPQIFMGVVGGVSFGPDTSIGVVLMPHMIFYYFLFFMVGAVYYDCQDQEGNLGRLWWCWFLVAGVVFLAYKISDQQSLLQNQVLASGLLQVVYAWAMVFGMIGLFRALFGSEKKWVRYLSDSAYWLYLIHLPVVVVLQAIVKNHDFPALLKFASVTVATSILLLGSYQLLVRHTPIGWILNGRRKRPQMQAPPSPSSSTSPSTPIN